MSPPIRDGSGDSIGSIRLGDGSEISEVRTGAGDVLFNAIPDSGIYIFDLAEDSAEFRARNLSTPFDISTNSVFYTTTTEVTSTSQNYIVDFKPDGSKVLLDNNDQTNIVQYDLSEPFDIRTRSNPTTINIGNNNINGASIVNNGNTMYVTIRNPDEHLQYNLSTEWDISTASLDASFTEQSGPNTLTTNNDGTKGYVQSSAQDSLIAFSLSTPFDFTTRSQDYTDSVQGDVTWTIRFSPDGDKYFEFDRDQGIYSWDLTTPFDTRTRTNRKNISSFNDSGGGTLNGFSGKMI